MPDEPKDLLAPMPIASPLAVFTEPSGLDPYLKRVRKAIDEWKCPGVDTRKGRDEIAAFAFKISRSKTALEEAGKELAAAQKEIPRKIDASRKFMRDTLDEWRDEVRAPLTKWEQAEQARVNFHKSSIMQLENWTFPQNTGDLSIQELQDILTTVKGTKTGSECQEFELEYVHAKEAAITALVRAIETREKYEAEQAELARLREEKLAREQAEREARIAREAAERAAREAEERQRREIENAKAAVRRAEAEKEMAEWKAQRAAEQAKRQIEDGMRREAEEADQRAADARHKARIHQEAYDSLLRELDNGLELIWLSGTAAPTISKFVLRVIAEGKISHVRFIY